MEAAICLTGAIIVTGFIFLVSAIRVVPEERRLRVYRLGRYIGEKGPGLVLLIPIIDRAEDAEVTAATASNAPLVGSIGETQDAVHSMGSVVIQGRTWDAMSAYPIAPKSKVRIKRVVLEVEEDKPAS